MTINADQILQALRPTFGKPGLSTKRAVEDHDVLEAINAASTAKRRVRVYSDQGFVPNSYRSRCEIQYVEGTKDSETGEWTFRTGWTGAQRSNGNGALVVVQ